MKGAMGANRRAQIMRALLAGERIYRFWRGGATSGYLSHSLAGVTRMREADVDVLFKEGVIRIACFYPHVLSDFVDPNAWWAFLERRRNVGLPVQQ